MEKRLPDPTLTIRLATLADIPAISQLQQKWLEIEPSETERRNGYLFGELFTAADFRTIIDNQECVAMQQAKSLVGYYLLDNFSQTPARQKFAHYIALLHEQGLLRSPRVATRAQSVIDTDFQNRGLSYELLNLLVSANASKYDLLFSVVARDNPKMVAHQKGGWETITETETHYWVIYDLQKHAAQLAPPAH